MRAWLPNTRVTGPEPATERDIEGLNHVFAEAFTDRYRRDGLVGVRVPQLNPLVWRYALLDAGPGAMVWRDEHDGVAAFNVAHRSGTEGWMGPLAVRPDRQGSGVGKTIVRTAADWLIDQGVATLGLETMPRTPENIGFYARLGFIPGHLTVTLTNEIATRGHPAPVLLSRREGRDKDDALEAARRLVTGLAPGYDFSREILLTAELGLGDLSLVEAPSGGEGGLDAMALWHSAPLADTRTRDEVRVLKLAARDLRAFEAVLAAAEAAAAKAGIRRVAVRCQTSYTEAFRRLIARGYRVRWTDLRMTYEGYPERHAAPSPEGGVLFSNWEI
ncbi:MAG TPA: GNAT family N-acetyltransferase [Gemmatimonadales bacterium]|jgi:GNAT superfamily N-acetyltransferase|nr:GNAT family N-acetyltransferase [Gemmatimonadales bacterium]